MNEGSGKLLRWHGRLARFRRGDSGITLTEIAVAMGVFGTVMMLLTGMVATSFRGILQGKQRSVAVEHANALVEQARNLPFEDVGIAPPSVDPTVDPSVDPAIVDHAGTLMYSVADPCNPGSTHLEPLQFASNPTSHPYNPHMQTTTTGSTSLTTYVYVTGVDENCDGTLDLRRVVVRTVVDDPAARGASNELVVETLVGQRSPGTTPPKNSALPPMSGFALAASPTSVVLVDRGSGADVENGDPDEITVELTTSRGNTTSLATNEVDCASTSPRVAVDDEEIGKTSASSEASDDPRAPAHGPNMDMRTFFHSPSFGGDVDRYLVESTLTGALQCTSQAHPWPSLPTTTGSALVGGTVTLAADVTGLGLPVGTVELMRADGAQATNGVWHTGTSLAARTLLLQAGTTLDEANVFTVNSLGVAAAQGLLRVSSYDFDAEATASPSAGAVTLAVGTGLTVDIYDPLETLSDCVGRLPADPYCRLVIDASASSFTGKSISVAENMGPDANDHPYSYQTTIDFNPALTREHHTTPGGKLYDVDYKPMSATVRLIFRVLDVTSNPLDPTYVPVFDAQVRLDLGRVLARGCYGVASGVTGCL